MAYREHWTVPGWYRHEPNADALKLAQAYSALEGDYELMPYDARISALYVIHKALEDKRSKVSEYCAPWFGGQS